MARRRKPGALTPTTASPAAPPPAGPARRPRWLAACAAIGAIALAWLISDVLVARYRATTLPELPDLTSMPSPVAEDLTAADAAARRAPADAAAVGALAMAYHAALQTERALQVYGLVERLAPQDWRWPYYRGLLHIERGEHEAAEAAMTTTVERAGRHGLAQYYRGELAFKAGRLDEAAAAYAAACEAKDAPPPPPAPPGAPGRRGVPLTTHCTLGLSRVELERAGGDAARDASAARTSAPPTDPWLDQVVARSRHVDLLLKHASLAQRAGDRAWREWLATRALDASPSSLDTLLEMASVLQDSNRHAEALDLLQRAAAVAPGDHHVLVETGQSLIALDRLTEAEAVLRRATRVRDASAEYNLGTVLDAMDRWDEAQRHYERALAINPFHARALNNLGTGFARRGRRADALAAYRRAIEAAPGDPEAYTNAAGVLTELRRFDDALAMVTKSLEIDSRQANAHNTRGILLALAGREADARVAFETALRHDPSHADARRNLSALQAPR